MKFRFAIYQHRAKGLLHWTTLGLGPHTHTCSGRTRQKLEQTFASEMAKRLQKLGPSALAHLQTRWGWELVHAHLELSMRADGRKLRQSGQFPLVLEPRWLNPNERIEVAYHPHRQDDWFIRRTDLSLEEQARAAFQHLWRSLSQDDLLKLTATGGEQLTTVTVSASIESLLDQLPDPEADPWADLERDLNPSKKKKKKKSGKRGLKALPDLGADLTVAASSDSAPQGMPRQPYSNQLKMLMGGAQRRSLLLVGPPGVGKRTLIRMWVQDLLVADGFDAHQDTERVQHVWQLSGKRMIAGMSYRGDWEQRCTELLQDAKKRHVILYIDDIHSFGRLGQSRESTRSFSSFFKAAVASGEVSFIGACTFEQLKRLEEDDHGFSTAFTHLTIQPTSTSDTLRMMLHEARSLELAHHVAFHPLSLRATLALGDTLISNSAQPGKALNLLRQLAKQSAGSGAEDVKLITADDVIQALSSRTGLPSGLIDPAVPLKLEQVMELLQTQVMGQHEAIRAGAEVIVKIKARMTDPGRPYSVLLFSGPTGTGKTELAKALAALLYGSAERLVRFDMSELNHPYAVSRLIGDRYQPQGQLTERVRAQPFCVLLFDEVEKAHPAVLNLLLQVFEDGRLSDAQGEVSHFNHTLIVMTSNLGATAQQPIGLGARPHEEARLNVLRAIQRFFSPELFNRIDQVLCFNALDTASAMQIAARQLERLLSRHGLVDRRAFVQALPGVIEHIIRHGFHAEDGARRINRYIEQHVGRLLTAHIAQHPDGHLQQLRLFERADRLGLQARILQESPPTVSDFSLSSLLDMSAAQLRASIPDALSFLDKLRLSDDLAHLIEALRVHLQRLNLGDATHAEPAYNLDTLRQRILNLYDHLQRLQDTPQDEESLQDQGELHEILEAKTFKIRSKNWRHIRIRHRLDHRTMQPEATSRAAFQPQNLFSSLAEVHGLQRALSTIHDPSQHVIFLELLSVAQRPYRDLHTPTHDTLSLFNLLLSTYARSGVEAAALLLDSGERVETTAQHRSLASALSAQGLPLLDEPALHANLAVLKIVGLNALPQLLADHGCHVFEPLNSPPQVVRVRVWSADASAPSSHITAHLRDRIALADALRTCDDALLPDLPDPDALLPAIRILRADALPPSITAPIPSLIIEDFALSHSEHVHHRSFFAVMNHLWLLHSSATPLPTPSPSPQAPLLYTP
jgi:ATP-dependent Clp protease ATP-binding subunit ClpC